MNKLSIAQDEELMTEEEYEIYMMELAEKFRYDDTNDVWTDEMEYDYLQIVDKPLETDLFGGLSTVAVDILESMGIPATVIAGLQLARGNPKGMFKAITKVGTKRKYTRHKVASNNSKKIETEAAQNAKKKAQENAKQEGKQVNRAKNREKAKEQASEQSKLVNKKAETKVTEAAKKKAQKKASEQGKELNERSKELNRANRRTKAREQAINKEGVPVGKPTSKVDTGLRRVKQPKDLSVIKPPKGAIKLGFSDLAKRQAIAGTGVGLATGLGLLGLRGEDGSLQTELPEGTVHLGENEYIPSKQIAEPPKERKIPSTPKKEKEVKEERPGWQKNPGANWWNVNTKSPYWKTQEGAKEAFEMYGKKPSWAASIDKEEFDFVKFKELLGL
jgi:hypothetical protein